MHFRATRFPFSELLGRILEDGLGWAIEGCLFKQTINAHISAGSAIEPKRHKTLHTSDCEAPLIGVVFPYLGKMGSPSMSSGIS